MQIALWEEYSCKLEAQVHALTSENDALQRRIASVQSSLANGAASGPASATQCLVGLLPRRTVSPQTTTATASVMCESTHPSCAIVTAASHVQGRQPGTPAASRAPHRSQTSVSAKVLPALNAMPAADADTVKMLHDVWSAGTRRRGNSITCCGTAAKLISKDGCPADWPGDEGDTSQRQSVASGAKYVEKLNEEFSKRAPMFQDDALFIKCGQRVA